MVMASAARPRETWGSRSGFILAAVGSAVGLGNIWRFPFQVGQEGGSAFLFVYLLMVLVIGLPAVLIEFAIGRRAVRNPIDAFAKLGYPRWTAVGVLGVLTGFVIMSFYAVVGGWVLRYMVASTSGSYFDAPEAYFTEVASGVDAVAFQFVFLAITAGIVAMGVRRGIELAVKLLVPALVVIMGVLIVYTATLEGAVDGYLYYLSPDIATLLQDWPSIVPAAMGQAFFTLSIGMGIMITYASYLREDRNLLVDGGWIVGIDTAIAILAGLMIFPVLFTIGIQPGEGGAGELFVGVGGAIGDLPAARLIGLLFFGALFVAALSSAISLTEVAVSFLSTASHSRDRSPRWALARRCSVSESRPRSTSRRSSCTTSSRRSSSSRSRCCCSSSSWVGATRTPASRSRRGCSGRGCFAPGCGTCGRSYS